MKLKLIIVLFLFTHLFIHANAQQSNSVNVVNVEGKQYLLHKVKKGETLFSICNNYKVEQKELVGANPQLIFGLKVDDSLKIPFEGKDEMKRNNFEMNKDTSVEFIQHLVLKSETIYSISKKYNISIQTIYRYNPEAEHEVLENEILRIPKGLENEEQDGLVREDDDFYFHKIQAKENLYSLSRKYNSSVAEILKHNPNASNSFEIGTIIRVPKFEEKVESVNVSKTGEFFYHRVEAGDTFYSYQRRFNVSKEELIRLNPELNDGLLTGLSIKIPSSKIDKVEVIPLKNGGIGKHVVGQGETLYSISKQYGVKILDIKEMNPELKIRGLVAGETLYIAPSEEVNITETISAEVKPVVYETAKIPVVTFKVEDKKQPECKKKYSVLSDDTFRISMFLPLFYDKNDQINQEKKSYKEIATLDSLKNVDPLVLNKSFKVIYNKQGQAIDTMLVDSISVKEKRSLYSFGSYSTVDFVNFYEGVLLAIDSMQKAGVKIRLDLYDSQNKQRTVDSILYNSDFINTNLIIGPVDVNLQKNVSAFSAKNQIPMVSPLSSTEDMIKNNPFYFQVNPSREYALRKTAAFISDEFYDKNFIILKLDNTNKVQEAELVNYVRDKFFSSKIYNNSNPIRFTEVDFTEAGPLGYWQVKKTLKPNVENVIFIPTTYSRDQREAMLSRAVNSLNVLAEEFDITLVGMSDYPRFRSINTEYFHKLKLHYLSPFYIDYTQKEVVDFVRKYRKNFSAEPDVMSFRGYDIASYFIQAYAQFGKNYSECIGSFSTTQLQSNFNFQKVSELGGFMNYSLFIINYTPNYDIEVKTVVTEGRIPLR